MNSALLVVRLCVGLGMAAHGAQKLFGWYGGYGLAGTGGFFEGLGFRPGKTFAFLAGTGEFTSGLLVALGLLSPLGSAIMTAVMTVALLTQHWGKGFFVAGGGGEVPMLYMAGALLLAFTGPGIYSLDSLLSIGFYWSDRSIWTLIAVALVVGVLTLAVRRSPPPAANPPVSGPRA